jgi:hypothetical protein
MLKVHAHIKKILHQCVEIVKIDVAFCYHTTSQVKLSNFMV